MQPRSRVLPPTRTLIGTGPPPVNPMPPLAHEPMLDATVGLDETAPSFGVPTFGSAPFDTPVFEGARIDDTPPWDLYGPDGDEPDSGLGIPLDSVHWQALALVAVSVAAVAIFWLL